MKKHAKKLCACFAVASVLVFASCIVENDPGDNTVTPPPNVPGLTGVFTGAATTIHNRNGHTYYEVTATWDNGLITAVKIDTDYCSNNNFCGSSATDVEALILEKQAFEGTIEDCVARATDTVTGFYEAVADIKAQIENATK